MNEYILPANSKKSGLILGLFTVRDIIILSIGLPITAIMLLIFKSAGFLMLVLSIIPGAIAVLLVIPVPHYHNVVQLLTNIFKYLMGRKKYEWRGWLKDEE